MLDLLKKAFIDRTFVICGVILFISAMGIQTLVGAMEIYLRKEAVPLVKPLSEFDARKMWPYKLVSSQKLQPEIEEELGTKEYLQMTFEDTRIKDDRIAGKYINFFVTYYTGSTDQVPHVPDVCYVGGGFDSQGTRNTTIKVKNLGLKNDELPVRELLFQNTRAMVPVIQPVIYFFGVNGTFVNDRTDVRLSLASPRLRYAYFSKVEVAFLGGSQPDKDQALEITGRFFSKAIPILMKDHWQNWDKFLELKRNEAKQKK
jgi:hypothetical protein